jgi:hypothetical protein
MSGKKIENILNLIEIAENNLKTARNLLIQVAGEKGIKPSPSPSISSTPSALKNNEEERALEVVEGYFDGESMIGDNGQTYIIPPNYASKTQLVIGDRMKWILTPEREVFKLIQPAPRERVIGTFAIEGENYVVLVDKYPSPIKILKASATFAMKNLGLQVGDEVAILIPRDATPVWGAFSSVVKSQIMGTDTMNNPQPQNFPSELDNLNDFKLDDIGISSDQDYF